MRTIIFPSSSTGINEVETEQSVVLVGANGSGKTRLGAWIEIQSPQNEIVHRISAHKSLTMPDSTTIQSIDMAERALLFGRVDYHANHKIHKWNSKPATHLLNDFEKLMVYLFSEESEVNAVYRRDSKISSERINPPCTKLDRIKELWESILPHRELLIGGLRIQTKVKNGNEDIYNSSEMSDGERVIFYLIGQCLSAPQGGIILIDEPELHLHKSVQVPLWDAIEKLRDDCAFVYLTHDVDFAASKQNSKKIWLKSYDGTSWDWDYILEDNSLPDELLIEVLGSRKPVIFVEGNNGSHDVTLYRRILPGFLVIPLGSCTKVIQTVKSLKENSQLHHLEIFGLIDRDRRNDTEIQSLELFNVFTILVAEVENLFCVKEVLELLSRRLARDANDDFQKISSFVFEKFQSEIETQVSLRASNEIKFRLNIFNVNKKGADNIRCALQELVSGINVDAIYNEESESCGKIINERDYDGLLKLYNRKSLASQIGTIYGLTKDSLPEIIIRYLNADAKDEFIKALKPYLGNFAVYMD
ncbi:DUF4435 domain-containing protein [Lelliottia amnigena]|uniref:DUF4435 domain-containing protein n=1 Tax=Lelliottia amnigena TaxID=61646 RepID=UPI001EF81E4A|nr:DUF4435 domain-containing protein [Lelliottia amnigena]MBM7356503.1 ABC-type lipoprotein export system ATPase subunit [Lelliottia amnigena]WSO18783.1 DUF4435 domain-containing protein [Lelliottia amnigena]